MPRPLYKLPGHFVKEWPEMFEDLYINTMPVHYVDFIRMEFHDGRIWEIDIKKQIAESHSQVVSERLVETLKEYKEDISKLDFRINIEKLKNDIQNSTKDFFK